MYRNRENLANKLKKVSAAGLGVLATAAMTPALAQAKPRETNYTKANPVYSNGGAGLGVVPEKPSLQSRYDHMVSRLAKFVLDNQSLQGEGAFDAVRQGKDEDYTAVISTQDGYDRHARQGGEYIMSIVAPTERNGSLDVNKIKLFSISEGRIGEHGIEPYSIFAAGTDVAGGQVIYQTQTGENSGKVLSFSGSVNRSEGNTHLTPSLVSDFTKMGELMLHDAEYNTPTHDIPAKYLPMDDVQKIG